MGRGKEIKSLPSAKPVVTQVERGGDFTSAVAYEIERHHRLVAALAQRAEQKLASYLERDIDPPREFLDYMELLMNQNAKLSDLDIRQQKVRLDWVRGLSEDELNRHRCAVILESLPQLEDSILVTELRKRGCTVDRKVPPPQRKKSL